MGYYENIYNGGKLSGVSILKMKKEQICIWLAWAGQQEEISLFLFFCVTNSGLLDAWGTLHCLTEAILVSDQSCSTRKQLAHLFPLIV